MLWNSSISRSNAHNHVNLILIYYFLLYHRVYQVCLSGLNINIRSLLHFAWINKSTFVKRCSEPGLASSPLMQLCSTRELLPPLTSLSTISLSHINWISLFGLSKCAHTSHFPYQAVSISLISYQKECHLLHLATPLARRSPLSKVHMDVQDGLMQFIVLISSTLRNTIKILER